MNRKAILIESSNVKGQANIPGARLDVENWSRFLQSDLGGGWSNSEIEIMHKPFSSDLQNALKVPQDCYCFVAFSGHGSDGSIVLNDYLSNYSVTELIPKCDKSTVVLDSCRGIEEATEVNFSGMVALTASAGLYEGAIRASHAQQNSSKTAYHAFNNREALIKSADSINNWLTSLAQAAKGNVKMHACSRGQGAGEHPSAGGFYTLLLLQSAKKWGEQITVEKTHSTKHAHDFAAVALAKYSAAKPKNEQQNPEYSPSWLAFPFAAKG